MEAEPPVAESRFHAGTDVPQRIGRFELIRELGRGTFAEVWLAWDPDLESHVAIKLLAKSKSDTEKRFLHEARMLRRINSMNVLSVYDTGRLDDGRPWFIVDCAGRGNLQSRLQDCRAQLTHYPATQLLTLAQTLASGLKAIHEADLVHRDIKPANILFATKTPDAEQSLPVSSQQEYRKLIYSDERLLVGDLGIAKDLSLHTQSSSMIGGTLYYLAPEQNIINATITPAVDTYAATAVFWNVLTDRMPPLPEQLEKSLLFIDGSWRDFIEQGMAAQATERFQSADEWLRGFTSVLVDADADTIVNPVSDVITATPDICPFKGLEAYQAVDATFFCGRESLVDELVNRLQLHPVLVVGGASGSGKSSLVRAGLVPALATGALPRSEHWQTAVMTPGNDPLVELERHIPAAGHTDTIGDTAVRLLIVDQFEEVFTQTDSDSRREFLSRLSDLSGQQQALIKLVIVVRADFYAECAREPWLAQSISTNQVLVSPMDPNELRRALTEPARKVGLVMEEGLVEAVLNDCGSFAGSMPLMAHAMVETWVRRKGNTLTLDGFHACGGVLGAINKTADLIYDSKLSESEQSATRSLMLKLVSASEHGPDTRRTVKLSSLEAETGATEMKGLVEQLTSARLLIVDNNEIQIAHEALLQSWPRLRRWIADSHDDLRTRERITSHAHDWQEMLQNSDLLYRGTALLTALEWQSANTDQLDATATLFLQQSQQVQQTLHQQALEATERSSRFRRWAIIGLSVLAFSASTASVLAFFAYQDSKVNAMHAAKATLQANARFAGALGATALAHVDDDPRLALVLAAESTARSNELSKAGFTASGANFDTRAAMISARQLLANGGPFLFGSPMVAGNALSIALNPQGSVLAVGQLDGAVQFYDVQTRKPVQSTVAAHSSGVRDMEFSASGLTMVSSGADGRLLVWRRSTAGDWQPKQLGSAADVIPDVDFHPLDSSVISANDDGTVRRWFIDGHSPQPEPLTEVAIGFNAIAISDDGTHVAAANADKTLSVWSLQDNQKTLGPLADFHSSHLIDLHFTASTDGLVTLTTDGESKLLGYPSGVDKGQRFQQTGSIGAIALDRTNGQWLVGDSAGRLTVWDVDANEMLHRSAAGHTQIINDIAMTRDSRFLATLGRDQVIRFWTLNDDYRLARELDADGSAAKGIAYSADGRMLAFGNRKGRVILWQFEPLLVSRHLDAHDDQVWALDFSSDSTLFASADRSGQIVIWNAATGRQIQIINGHEPVWSLLFSSDDRFLLVGGESQIARYSVADGLLDQVLDNTVSRITRLVDAGDGESVISTSADGQIRIHSQHNIGESRTLVTENDIVWSVAVDQKRQLVASASGNETVTLYDIADGSVVDRLTGHAAGATNLDFLGDGKTLVVTDRTGMIHWWDIDSRRRLATPWRGHQKSIWRMALHPDRIRFATASDDGKVKLWSALDIDRACAIGHPGFDQSQRQQYFADEQALLACEKQ